MKVEYAGKEKGARVLPLAPFIQLTRRFGFGLLSFQ